MEIFLHIYSKSILLFDIIKNFHTHSIHIFFHHGPIMHYISPTRLIHLQHTAFIHRIALLVFTVTHKWSNIAI